MVLKIVIAKFNHETNSFSPISTPISAFGVAGPAWGRCAYEEQKGANSCMSAFIDMAESLGAKVVTPVAAEADPSCPMSYKTYCEIIQPILEAVVSGCDAIMLDLHGSMLAEGVNDGEGVLLEEIRKVAPRTPICISLDLHANVTDKIVENADIIVGFKTYPHIDIHATGYHAARLLRGQLLGVSKPIVRWCQLPLLASTLSMDTSKGAMELAIKSAIAAECEPGVLAVSVFGGFPLADCYDAGMSVVVVTDNNPELATKIANRIALQIWRDRENFVYRSKPLLLSLQEAKSMAKSPGSGPILILDHSDNLMSGGSCETMDILAAVLEVGLVNFAAGPVTDAQAVADMIVAGVGSLITLPIGNKVQLAKQGIAKEPLVLSGKIVSITDGEVEVREEGFATNYLRMGRSVLFDIGVGQLLITERRVEPGDLGVFTSVGVNPKKKTYLVLKSRMYSRVAFEPIAKGLIECDSDVGGPTSSNYSWFPISEVRRPIYPLDRCVEV